MSSTLIQSVHLIDPLGQTERVANVLLAEGQIQSIDGLTADEIASLPQPPDRMIDGSGWVLGPGLIDLYSQSGEPGHESRETVQSLLASARAGGFTRVGILPTTVPAVDTPAQVESLLGHCLPDQPQLMPWGALTVGTRGQQLTELATLARCGIVGFSDGQPLVGAALLKRLLEYGQPLARPIALWPSDRTWSGLIRDGVDAVRLGLAGLPATVETAPLATLLEQVAETHTPVHIMRVSTTRSVELIRTAKQRGLPVTASVVWLHLLRNTQDLFSYDPMLRLDPPLGTPADQQALIAGLEEGTIDAIAIDHTAYTYEEKTVAFGEAPPGAIGLELALPLLWRAFVASGRWQPWQLWRYLSTQPARCLGQPPPTVSAHQPTELTLFDPEASWQVSPDTLHSRSSNTSWLGQTIQGRVQQVWLPQPTEREAAISV
ncbi:MAG: dihydroorotase [Cyanobacteria bacterium J06628_6]